MFYAYGFDKGSLINRLTVWERIKARSGKEVDELTNKPDLPEHSEYIWNLYTELKKGCDEIRYVDINAYQQITGINMTAWEVDLIMQIETERRNNG